ncbi:LysR family transcriptional regulator [Blastopirellula marina]|uniref:Hydrogen peroxide-inducible genes activator n=1 Tax=Blastopirellula marina DSM 3645 TaxID=314230 RepID=A4A1M3_9BACT|nr:hydrogen peroxide-inducible genes activator [Blastopirellula marina]EAQ77328.1 hydrogen peroxide-inducible genes activator [Blastopirellula marina DSM 3645]
MEISQLRYFLKVAEWKNFTRAAEDLLVSQPALSRSIGKLEEELGQPVFERQTRSVVLTEAGRLLQSRAEQILSLIEDTKSEITDDGRTGRIRIGAIPTIAPYFLPGLLQAFAATSPDSTLTVQEEVTEKLLQRVAQGEIDVALLALPISMQHIEVETLFDEELLLAMPAGHPLATKKRITIADVRPYPFILLDEAHCLSDNIVSFCRQKSFHPVSVEKTSQLATVQELVALGHGVSMVPEMARRLDHDERRIYSSLSAPKPQRTIAMAWNPYRFQSRLVERFKEVTRKYRLTNAA